ncbi:MAG: glycosyltransferase [Bacteroidota bacterium]
MQKIAARQKRTEFHAVYISNMIPSKGYEDVAMGLAIARREHGLPLRADFVGGWPSEQARAQFDAMLASEGLSDVVTVHGAVHDRPWIRERLLSADAFLLPTYYPVEAQPLSIIEALNAATPVISTHHASIPDYIRNDENGYLVGKKNPAEIAEALRRLHDLPTWSRLARNARDTFDSTFGPEVIRSAFLEAFAP